MKNFFLLMLILLIFSCGSDNLGNKFPVGSKFAYQITTQTDDELLAEISPNSTVGVQFEVINNENNISILSISDENGISNKVRFEVHNEGYVLNEKQAERFINEKGLSLHQIYYLFVPLPSIIPSVNEEWIHKQKLPSAMSISEVDFEDKFVYKITESKGNFYKIEMRAKVGAMSTLQEGDNVTGEYTVNKKTGLVEKGNIDIKFMTGGKIHIKINKIDFKYDQQIPSKIN